jgi:hypothetical protein
MVSMVLIWNKFRDTTSTKSQHSLFPLIKDLNYQLQDTAAQVLAEELAEEYIGKSFALWLKRINAFLLYLILFLK